MEKRRLFNLVALICGLVIFFSIFIVKLHQTSSNYKVIKNDQNKILTPQETTNSSQQTSLKQETNKITQTNKAVCDRFETALNQMSDILDKEKTRQGVTDTVVAYGRGNTPLDSAAYYLTYAAEAVSYQRSLNFNSQSSLKINLLTLQSKVERAKTEIKKALDYYNSPSELKNELESISPKVENSDF